MNQNDFNILMFSILTISISLILIGSSMIYHKSLYSESYSCVEMSEDIEDKLEFIGFNVTLITGYPPEGDGHMWLIIHILGFRVQLDSVTLQFVDNTEYYNEYITEYNDFSDTYF